ncbi:MULTISPECIES: hypothetical protein [Streptomyces]|uniref:hypothetical protein n=1 Tax=Streptomyces TaxID=1883 RepID=UPI0035E2D949
MEIDQATTDQVFEDALAAVFQDTDLGKVAYVGLGDYAYRVIAGGDYVACIDGRQGNGGMEYIFANATAEQDRALREVIAAQAAK